MTSVFEVSERYVEELCALRPTLATLLGVEGRDHEWGEHGMESVEAQVDLGRRFRSEFQEHVKTPAFLNRLAARVSLGMIEENLASYEEGDHFRDLRHLGCTFQHLRNVFDIMPKETADHWSNVVSRLETLASPLDGYIEVLDEGRARGQTVAQRQADSVATQAESLGGEQSSFLLLLDQAEAAGLSTPELESAVNVARTEMRRFGDWLRSHYLPDARLEDAVGAHQYARSADRLVGMRVDPDEAYEWGWSEFDRLRDEMGRLSRSILPGGSFEEVKEHLESDPSLMANSTEELVDFVSGLLASAVDDLAGTHFVVPDEIRRLTVQIAPPGSPLGVYYIGPSEDLSRPGGVWYAVGDQDRFPLYQHVSTAYHEGFPGHHLQIGTARYRREQLSRAHRLLAWYPGYHEGWAMYAEVLMGELGYLEDPRLHFGMLAKQMYRAARIVVDIGIHLHKKIPVTAPFGAGGEWDFDTAVEFMRIFGFRTQQQAEAEVLRYMGWPGQAISYKLGEREILAIRSATRTRLGADFDLSEFHASLLNHGTMRLDLLSEVVEELLPVTDP